jgi:aspartyl-tRNA(Asn)/glutamyl-tRNA(Gln) amidotransferase subunit A
MVENYYYSSIHELSKRIREQRVSPVVIVNTCLKRIEALNPKLNAFITVLADQAVEQAKDIEAEIKAGNWRGPLHGIPVGVKDFFDTAGIRTTGAFEPLKNRVPTKDAEVVTRLKNAGAIIIGKMNMHELGMGTTSLMSCFGSVHNPWDQNYVAGGSSGGSAAAVAAGMCFSTVDTDAIGSCRLPASCCGVIGFKPTCGLISTKGILDGELVDEETAQSLFYLSHTAFTCRMAEDAAILLKVLTCPAESKSEYTNDDSLAFDTTNQPRIGIVTNFKATDEVRTAFLRAVDTFHALGYAICENIQLAFPSFDFMQIEEDRQTVSQKLFKQSDVLILPTTTDVTPAIDEAKTEGPQAVSSDNTFFCNYYGLPAISVPCGFDAHALPLGLQIVGKPGDEGAVLQLAHQYQTATEYGKKHPIP